MRQNVKKQTVRLNAEEYAKLKSMAAETGISMEALIRKLIMGESLRHRPPDSYANILRQLSAIGNNINQLAYWANATKRLSSNEIQEAVSLAKQAFTLVKENL